MTSLLRTRTVVAVTSCAAVITIGLARTHVFTESAPVQQRNVSSGTLSEFLHWPLPPNERAYGSIDGNHLKTYVDDLSALTRKLREPGNQYWGRITGMPSDAKVRDWVEAKFRAVGLQDVRIEPFDVVEPQWIPGPWHVDASAGGKTLKLASAHPFTKTRGTAGEVQMQAVWLGLGTKADFVGHDVHGKAAFIYSQPFPSWHNSSVSDYKAVERAADAGASAVFVIWGVPGNFEVQAGSPGKVTVPVFSLGKQDGESIRELIEAGQPVTVNANLTVKNVPGLKSGTVWGTLPGASAEEIIVMAHRDAFFEGAGDNASGVATMLGVAEYFAKVPQAQRRRTIRFMASTGHHMTGPTDVAKLHTNRDTALAKTVLILNPEHVGWTETYAFGGNSIFKANAIAPLRWSVNGSDRLKTILFGAITEFGMITLQDEESAWGDANPIKDDVPAISLIQSPYFWHCSCDTPDNVPSTGLEVAARVVTKIIDEANKLDRRELTNSAPQRTSAKGQ